MSYPYDKVYIADTLRFNRWAPPVRIFMSFVSLLLNLRDGDAAGV